MFRPSSLALAAGVALTAIAVTPAVAPPGRPNSQTMRGHRDGIFAVAASPEGKLATAGRDGSVRIWDATTGQSLHTLRGHSGQVLRVCYSADGKKVASAGGDKTARVWDAATGMALHTLKGHN